MSINILHIENENIVQINIYIEKKCIKKNENIERKRDFSDCLKKPSPLHSVYCNTELIDYFAFFFLALLL
jgi:hypothetical protein